MKQGSPVSPLRYPGAKRWISGYISRSIARNHLLPSLFVEPFVGGGSVAIAQLHAGLVQKVVLNDIDPLVAALWKTVFFDTNWLISKILRTDVTLDEWKRQKASRPISTRGLAFKCLFLNRTSFSGVLTNRAGPLGGQCQRSQYKIDCRFNKATLIRRIEEIAAFSPRVAGVWNLPWKSALSRVAQMQEVGALPKASIVYLDPPFYRKASGLYRHYFDHQEHLRLRDFLMDFDDPWILSYDACPEVLELYRRDNTLQASAVHLIYTASQKSKRCIGREIIVSNLPQMVSELQLGVGKHSSAPRRVAQMSQPGRKIAAA